MNKPNLTQFKKLLLIYTSLISLNLCISNSSFADNLNVCEKSYNLSGLLPNRNSNQWEVTIAPVIEDTMTMDNSQKLSGARTSFTNFFYKINKYNLILGADFSVNYLRTSKSKDEPDFSKSITIFSPALLARWYPDFINNRSTLTRNKLKFYAEAGVGPSYMSNDDFEGRDLGSRFAFQDIGGMGLTINNKSTIGIYLIHYSNANLANKNRGITLPITARVSYRF